MKIYRHRTCPVCGVEQSKWASDGGRGVTVSGTTYCCEGCFTGAGCVCAEIRQRTFAVAHAAADFEEGRSWPSEGSPD